MNCKPGDLAIVVGGRDPNCPPRRGTIVKVDRPSKVWPQCWVMDPPIVDPADGYSVHVQDKHLCPIRDPGDDAVDETLLRLPSPRQEVTA